MNLDHYHVKLNFSKMKKKNFTKSIVILEMDILKCPILNFAMNF